MMQLLGAIEAGGTKFICALGTETGELRAHARFPTTTPAETIERAVAFFRAQTHALEGVAAVGVASFGPLDLDPGSPSYGFITSTPKPGWAHTDLVGPIGERLNLPVRLDTDVNAAALAEWRWGCGQGLDSLVYLTVGTGIGGGALVNGRPIHGLLHPEMGHFRLPHDLAADPFPGGCPYHRDCLEGLASGPAIEKRWGIPAERLPPDHPAWALEAHYLALGVMAILCTLSPRRVILGGGVMQQAHLFPRIRAEVVSLLNGYLQSPAILDRIDETIVPPALGAQAGILGALALACPPGE
jgi:fructokinase